MFGTLASIFILVFSTQESDTIVGTFSQQRDCEEVAWSIHQHVSGATLACEELPPCTSEDDDECFWDAGKQGNGVGTPFLVW